MARVNMYVDSIKRSLKHNNLIFIFNFDRLYAYKQHMIQYMCMWKMFLHIWLLVKLLKFIYSTISSCFKKAQRIIINIKLSRCENELNLST